MKHYLKLITIYVISILDPHAASYLVLLGHGVCYIPALTYINIRSSQTGTRIFRISLAHIFYLFGVAVGAMVTVKRIIIINRYFVDKLYINSSISLIITVSSALLLVGYILNEICQFQFKNYNYKMSLDHNVQRENDNKEIFKRKIFTITKSSSEVPPTNDVKIAANARVEILSVCMAIIAKGLSLCYFYYPFGYLSYYVTQLLTVQLQMKYFQIHWIGFAGIVASAILLTHVGIKRVFISSCIMKVIILIVLTIITSMSFSMVSLKVFFYISYFFFAFGYSYADVVCFEIVNLKYTEITLVLGYLAEMIAIGTIQYGVITNVYDWFCFSDCRNVDIILKHSLAFIILSVILVISAIYTMPRVRSTMSLLEAKNRMINFKHKGMIHSNPIPPTINVSPQDYYPNQNPVLVNPGSNITTNHNIHPLNVYPSAPDVQLPQYYPPYQSGVYVPISLPPAIGLHHQMIGDQPQIIGLNQQMGGTSVVPSVGMQPPMGTSQIMGYPSTNYPMHPPPYSENDNFTHMNTSTFQQPSHDEDSLEKQTKLNYRQK